MAGLGFAGNVLSVILSIIMAFSSLPIGSILNNAENWNKDEIAAEKMQLFAEYLDAAMQIEFENPIYFDEEGNGYMSLEEIPEGEKYFELDISSINNTLAFAKRVTEDEDYYGGDFTKLDFSALDGKSLEDDNALEIVYDAVQFLADNTDLVGNALVGDFDYGLLGEVMPEFFGKEGAMNNFDLYEVIMYAILNAYDNGESYRESPMLVTDENGAVILARRNNVYEAPGDDDYYKYLHNEGECIYDGNENVFHAPYSYYEYGYNEETGIWESTYTDYQACYTALTDAEKANFSADSKVSDIFSMYLKEIAMEFFDADDEEAQQFINDMDFTDGGFYAYIPALLNMFYERDTREYGDTFIHFVRELIICAYGGGFDGDDYFNSSRTIDCDSEYYDELVNYYYSNYQHGDYALFDYSLGGFEMFEASYKEDGSLVFYGYLNSIKGNTVEKFTESIFDCHFVTSSDYVLTAEERDYVSSQNAYTKITGSDGNRYLVVDDYDVWRLYESVFPVAEKVSAETIASLTAADLIAEDEPMVLYADSAAMEFEVNKAFYKDGRFYLCTIDENGKEEWSCWTSEEETTVCQTVTDALASICNLIDPYYTYNENQYDFVKEAEKVGGGFVEQINNVCAFLIENTFTEEAKAELGWVAGSNDNLNDNIMRFIRLIADRVFTEEFVKEYANFRAVAENYDKAAEAEGYMMNLYEILEKFIDASYYENATLEDVVVDIIFAIIDDTKFRLEMDGSADESEIAGILAVPENADSLEKLAAYFLVAANDMLFEDMYDRSDYVDGNGMLVEKSDEEWLNVILDYGFELAMRLWAENAEESAIVFTKEEIESYKLKGWTYMDFLDELFDRFYVYIEGTIAICDDLQCELGVLDGNGPWYKISRVINALLPTGIFPDCSKKYGTETLAFDLGVFFEEALIGNVLNMDLSSLLGVLAINENDANPFYKNNLLKSGVIIIQNFINAVLPGAIADEDIITVDHFIDEDTLKKVATQVINALNDRKTELVPVIISWFEMFGAFETIPHIDTETGFGYYIREDKDGKYASVSEFIGNDFDLAIPAEIEGLPVKGYEINYWNDGTTVELPDTIKYFDVRDYCADDNMFVVSKNNPYFESVDGVLYNEDMTEILSYPYFKTDEEFVVPATVKTVYAVTFNYNSYLRTLKLSEGVQEISGKSQTGGSYNFNSNLKDIYIPNSVEEISSNVFGYHYGGGDFTLHGAIKSYAYEFYNEYLSSYSRYSFEIYNSSDLYVTLVAEKQAVKSNIYVYGYAPAGATVKIYDGDRIIGVDNNISADKYSKWEAHVPLYKPVDSGSYHDIKVVAEKGGKTVESKTITVYYEKNAIVFKEFRINHNGRYQVTVTDENINRYHSLTWIPGGDTSFRVRVLNSNKLSALYLVSNDNGVENRVTLERSGNDYWIAENAFLGNPPGIIRIEGVVKNKGKLETIQIGSDIKINFLIDPSGNIYEFNETNPLEGVTATVQYYDSSTYEWVTWDAEYYEQINPVVTDKSGGFKWIVPKGQWRVVCEKDGYNTFISDTYYIPPEKTDLKYYMTTNQAPTVKECYYSDGVITIVYDQYMNSSVLNDWVYNVEGAEISSVSPADSYYGNIGGSEYSYSYINGYKTVKLYCNVTEGTAPASVTINGAQNYNNIYIEDNTKVVPSDLTKYYDISVAADKTDVTVGDLVTLTLTTTDAAGETVEVSVSNEAIFDTVYNVYDELGDITETVDTSIPETVTFDENGTAVIKLAAGFEGNSDITFRVGGTTTNYNVKVNAKAPDVHEHSFGPLTEVASTCEVGGYSYRECECGELEYTAYALAAHNPAEKVTQDALRTEATCRAAATYYYSCEYCDKVLNNGETGSKVYFSYGETAKHELAEDGKCKNCSYVETTYVPDEECKHENVKTFDKAPTCKEPGVEGFVICEDCGEPLYAGTIIPPQHTKIVTDKAEEATCKKTGLTEGSHCEDCGDVIVAQEVIPAKKHVEVIDKAVEATCTKTGLTEGSHCENCGDVIEAQEVIPVKKHNEVSDKAVAATCTKTGLTAGSHCKDCNTVIVAQTVVPAIGHKSVVVGAKDATASENGYTGDTICSVCKTELSKGQIIPALGGGDNTEECSHMCHKGGFSKIIWNLLKFFFKLFKIQPVCECGVAHY